MAKDFICDVAQEALFCIKRLQHGNLSKVDESELWIKLQANVEEMQIMGIRMESRMAEYVNCFEVLGFVRNRKGDKNEK